LAAKNIFEMTYFCVIWDTKAQLNQSNIFSGFLVCLIILNSVDSASAVDCQKSLVSKITY